MRVLLFGLMATLLGASARGGVVLTQIGGASDFSGTTISSSSNLSISWTSGFAGSFDSVKLRIYNQSSTTPIQALALKFALSDTSGTSVTGTKTYDGVNNRLSDFSFNLAPLNLSFTSGQSGSLYFRLDTSTGGTANWSTTNRGPDQYFGWTLNSTNPSSGQFELNATAVPEPTTMLLTGSILGAGICGAFLRRFRSKVLPTA